MNTDEAKYKIDIEQPEAIQSILVTNIKLLGDALYHLPRRGSVTVFSRNSGATNGWIKIIEDALDE